MAAKVVLMGGMGFPITESPWGMPQLKTRLESIDIEVLLTSWKDRSSVYSFLADSTGFRGLLGDSLGAGSAAQFAGDQNGLINFVGGFQPSMDDARADHGLITVAANVVRAHCIYDPRWIDTVGLGQATYVTAHGAGTILLVTQHYGAHPDDWGYSQDIMFNEVKALAGG